MNYYDEIKENLIKCEIYDRSKDLFKNRNRVITYFKNGKLLYEAGKQYGKSVIKKFRQLYPDSNIVAIDYDPGASHTNQINRIKLMLTVAKDNIGKK